MSQGILVSIDGWFKILKAKVLWTLTQILVGGSRARRGTEWSVWEGGLTGDKIAVISTFFPFTGNIFCSGAVAVASVGRLVGGKGGEKVLKQLPLGIVKAGEPLEQFQNALAIG